MDSLLIVFPFEGSDPEQIEAVGRKILHQPVEAAEHSDRRAAFFAGRAALAFAFKYLKIKAFAKTCQPYGYLSVVDDKGKGIPNLYCNVTHTDKLALAAVCTSPVGVDVERMDRSVSQVIRRILSAEEKAALSHGNNPELDSRGIRTDLALWCAKEAYTKALGLGLGAGLEQITVDIGHSPPFPVVTDVLGPQALSEPLVEVSIQNDYLIAICSEAENIQKGFKKLHFEFG